MKAIALSLYLPLAIVVIAGCSSTEISESVCDHPIRLDGDSRILIPADFNGKHEVSLNTGEKAIITSEDCQSFVMKIVEADGSAEVVMTFSKGGLEVDTTYVSSPESPNDLLMTVDTVYATYTSKGI